MTLRVISLKPRLPLRGEALIGAIASLRAKGSQDKKQYQNKGQSHYKKSQAGGKTMGQSDLQIFDFEGQQTRIVMKDGVPWWIGKDICDILGYANSRGAIEKHCKHKEIFGVPIRDTGKGSVQQMAIIPESDVYRLILRSNLPEAEKFETWLMEEVLPSIRKYGAYMTPQKIDEATLNPEMITPLLQALKNEQDVLRAEKEKVAELEAQIKRDKSKVSDGEYVQTHRNKQETILFGRFTKISHLMENHLLLVWYDPAGPNSSGWAAPSTTLSTDSRGDLCFEYGSVEQQRG